MKKRFRMLFGLGLILALSITVPVFATDDSVDNPQAIDTETVSQEVQTSYINSLTDNEPAAITSDFNKTVSERYFTHQSSAGRRRLAADQQQTGLHQFRRSVVQFRTEWLVKCFRKQILVQKWYHADRMATDQRKLVLSGRRNRNSADRMV